MGQINFYHHQQRIVQLGKYEDEIKSYGFNGRREVFEIADDEQLIRCKHDQDEAYFLGVTWIKMKVLKVRGKKMEVQDRDVLEK